MLKTLTMLKTLNKWAQRFFSKRETPGHGKTLTKEEYRSDKGKLKDRPKTLKEHRESLRSRFLGGYSRKEKRVNPGDSAIMLRSQTNGVEERKPRSKRDPEKLGLQAVPIRMREYRKRFRGICGALPFLKLIKHKAA